MKYAAETSVSVEKSRAEIETTVRRYGATEFASGWKAGQAIIHFKINGRDIRFVLPLPLQSESQFKLTPGKKHVRSPDEQLKAWEQACRQKWRALALAVKAKLEAVSSGISEFDQEFMAYIVMPDGLTIGEHLGPRLESVLTGATPLLGYTPQ